MLRDFAAVTGSLSHLVAQPPSVAAGYDLLTQGAIDAYWGPLSATRVMELRPNVFTVRMAFRVGAPDSTDRVIVIELREGISLGERVEAAAARWSLSARQREVLDHVARGLSNKEIAAALGCAEVTVEKHVTAVLRAANVDGRGRLVAQLTAGR